MQVKDARTLRAKKRSPIITSARTIYEQLRPLIIWLGLTELAWISYWLLSDGRATPGYVAVALFWVVSMIVWMGSVILGGKRGVFLQRTHYLSNLVGVVIVLAFAGLFFGAIPVARDGLVLSAGSTPDTQLIAIHILRVLAIGTVIKYLHGELPLHFVILGSLPDLLFGISAVAVMALVINASVGPDFLIAWHLIGFSVFFGAGISMFFSMPSPLRIFHGKPDATIVFQFPMLLAPNFTVPLFMLAHVFALVKLYAA